MITFGNPAQVELFKGVLRGTTKTAGNPDAPVARRVQLFEATAGQVLANQATAMCTTTVSGADGEWEATGLNPALKYNVIAYDHTGQYDPVVKLNLTPTVD